MSQETSLHVPCGLLLLHYTGVWCFGRLDKIADEQDKLFYVYRK